VCRALHAEGVIERLVNVAATAAVGEYDAISYVEYTPCPEKYR